MFIGERCFYFIAQSYASNNLIHNTYHTYLQGEPLASGLVKITIENLGASTMLPDPYYSMYHFSHPPLVERLKAINNYTQKESKSKQSKKADSKSE